MEKISQIVPSNPRMTAADLPKSGAVRPGAPGFGRQTGESRGGPVKDVSTAERAMTAASSLADQRRAGESKIIDQLARDFFLSEPVGPAADALQPGSSMNAAAIRDAVAPPRGSLIDVMA